MSVSQRYLGVLLFFCLSCSTELSKINPSFVKVYFFGKEASNEVYCFDAQALPSNDILVFGIGSNANNRFETNGHLYFQKVKANGETAWRDSLVFSGGFPSNVTKNDKGEFVLIWNLTDSLVAVVVNDGDQTPTIKTQRIKKVSSIATSYVINMVADGAGYRLQGTSSEAAIPSGASTRIFVSEVDGSFVFKSEIDSLRYIQSSFGDYGSSDLPYVRRIGKYLKLWKHQGTGVWYSVAPKGEYMALREVGSGTDIYTSKNKWIDAYTPSASATISAVLSHPDDISAVYYWPSLDLSQQGQGSQTQLGDTLKGWDTSSPFNVITIERLGKTLITGTSSPKQIRLMVIDKAGYSVLHEELGQAFPYISCKTLLLDDGYTVAIVGTCLLNNTYKRIFLIKLPVSEL